VFDSFECEFSLELAAAGVACVFRRAFCCLFRIALARALWSFPLDPGAHLSDSDDEMTADSSSSSSFEVSDAMARRDRAMSATRPPKSTESRAGV
jgi:hypothetical protein